MNATGVTPRNFIAHVEITAQDPAPIMRSGLYESIGEFFAVTGLYADLDAPFEKFEPAAGYTAAVAYRSDPSAPTTDYPFILATYVEGDVTCYRFTRHGDAARDGRLWAVGTPASAA